MKDKIRLKNIENISKLDRILDNNLRLGDQTSKEKINNLHKLEDLGYQSRSQPDKSYTKKYKSFKKKFDKKAKKILKK